MEAMMKISIILPPQVLRILLMLKYISWLIPKFIFVHCLAREWVQRVIELFNDLLTFVYKNKY